MKNKCPNEYSSVMASVIALTGLPYAERYLETVTRVGNNAKWQPTETRVQMHKRQIKQLQIPCKLTGIAITAEHQRFIW
jgi:hypothetical protein